MLYPKPHITMQYKFNLTNAIYSILSAGINYFMEQNSKNNDLESGKHLIKFNEFEKALAVLLDTYSKTDTKTSELCRLIGFSYQMLGGMENLRNAEKFYKEAVNIHKVDLDISKMIGESRDSIVEIVN